MEKTRSDIVSTLEDNLADLFNEAVEQVKEAVGGDSGAEDYADEQGYAEDSEDEDIRNLIIAAYNAGRDAVTAALDEAADEALG